MAEWDRALDWTGDRVVLGLNPTAATSLWNFGNSVYPALPVYFGGDTKSHWSLQSGVYARGSKRSDQSALEICNLSWTPLPSLYPICNNPHIEDAVTGRNRNR